MKHFLGKIYLICVLTALLFPLFCTAQLLHCPKREFRGAWIQAVNGQFLGRGTQATQAELTRQLDALQACGVNAVFFQVRVEGDALYASPYEPWSRFLTGRQGAAPQPYWDPLEWIVAECHKRGMELHAWINPFRAKVKGTHEIAATHPYALHPERFFEYDGIVLFDPSRQENRTYICQVAADIVSRYDIDGLHIDDYFYPYPAAGIAIPDNLQYERSGTSLSLASWRRDNVNRFVRELSASVKAVKPWVRFGVSPFGIYHNAEEAATVPGSQTRGLQCYDDLYADVLLWAREGWVDYIAPQIYWEIGHQGTDYMELVKWWAENVTDCPVYVGQDVERTINARSRANADVDQMQDKFYLQRSTPGIGGSVLWYSAAVANNVGNYATRLRQNYHRSLALPPADADTGDAPKKPRKTKAMWMPDGYYLFWTAPKAKKDDTAARFYAIYRFAKGEKVDTGNAAALVAVTSQSLYRLPYDNGREKYTYVVTAIDRNRREGKGQGEKVKL